MPDPGIATEINDTRTGVGDTGAAASCRRAQQPALRSRPLLNTLDSGVAPMPARIGLQKWVSGTSFSGSAAVVPRLVGPAAEPIQPQAPWDPGGQAGRIAVEKARVAEVMESVMGRSLHAGICGSRRSQGLRCIAQNHEL